MEKENITSSTLINKASVDALYFGAISSAYLFITQGIKFIEPLGQPWQLFVNILIFLIWIIKLIACIYLMKNFMKKLYEKYAEVNSSVTFRYGSYVSLFSAFIFAGVSLIFFYIFRDSVINSFDQVINSAKLQGKMTEDIMSSFESIKNNFHIILFFSQLIYCSLYGIILSKILSKIIDEERFSKQTL